MHGPIELLQREFVLLVHRNHFLHSSVMHKSYRIVPYFLEPPRQLFVPDL